MLFSLCYKKLYIFSCIFTIKGGKGVINLSLKHATKPQIKKERALMKKSYPRLFSKGITTNQRKTYTLPSNVLLFIGYKETIFDTLK
ncbi:MAG: hypothetical protein COA94_03420 [Rickettsiales bacterium]|nr:MAG: hypothetical protein COA94_03420 [Rickettsiales bacterium]